MTEVIDDLVVLGRAMPEVRPRGGGSKAVCLAGISLSRGFVRLDPCPPQLPANRWTILEIEVGRKRRDLRAESYTPVNASTAYDYVSWESVLQEFKVVGELTQKQDRRQLIERYLVDSIEDIKDRKQSLCLVKPTEILKAEWVENERFNKPYQTTMWDQLNDEWVQTIADYQHIPRMRFTVSGRMPKQGFHDMQYFGWDAYETYRKYPDKPDQFWKNLRIGDPEWELYLFIGNLAVYPTSYIIITAIHMKKESAIQQPLF